MLRVTGRRVKAESPEIMGISGIPVKGILQRNTNAVSE